MKHILLAGGTGYLGSFIAVELKKRGYTLTVIVRKSSKSKDLHSIADHVIEGDLRDPKTYEGVFKNIDMVISTVGITKQKDNLTYMDVDYGINRLLLDEGEKNSIEKFVYVSVLHGNTLRDLAICDAKERFVDDLNHSFVESTVIRPSGFFSDMEEFYEMANRGRIYLFGDGSIKANPIHGRDLAKVCVDGLNLMESEIEVGGPEVLTHKEIGEIAFKATRKPIKITYIPDWVRKFLLKILPWFMNKYSFGPVEFFLNVMAMDMTAPRYGNKKLLEHFKSLIKKD